MIIASSGVNRLQVANYHINEFKNYSLRLVENVNGVKDVASFSSFMLPLCFMQVCTMKQKNY